MADLTPAEVDEVERLLPTLRREAQDHADRAHFGGSGVEHHERTCSSLRIIAAILPGLIAAARRLAEVEAERDELLQRVADLEAAAERKPPWTDEQWRDILRKS